MQIGTGRFHVPALIVVTAFLAFGGCGTVAPRLYLLGYPSDVTSVMRDETALPLIEVEPVLVPDFQDSRDILVRKGTNELVADPLARWGERLSVGMTRALTTALAKRQPDFRVTSSQPVLVATRKVRVDVDTFEIREDGLCLLGARWSITKDGDRQTTTTDYARFSVQAVGVDTGAVVVAMTQAIDQLGDRISEALNDQ